MDMGNSDKSFDSYRRERKRMQAKLGLTSRPASYDNNALRELEEVEAREVREQQLTREVHEFFTSATRQAANIVERVSRDAEAEAGLRVEQEMEAFLIDALARMNTFVVTVLQQRRAPIAEQHVEPKVGNLVGQSLDEFRWAGTAEVGDKHIGQDPFATDVNEVRAEFRAQVGEPSTESAPPDCATPIDEDPVASVAAEAPPVPAFDAATEPPLPTPAAELERFKEALKSLVQQGTMSKDEARAAWQTRLQSLGQLA